MYKGKSLMEIPLIYLVWCADTGKGDPEVLKMIKGKEIFYRRKKLSFTKRFIEVKYKEFENCTLLPPSTPVVVAPTSDSPKQASPLDLLLNGTPSAVTPTNGTSDTDQFLSQ